MDGFLALPQAFPREWFGGVVLESGWPVGGETPMYMMIVIAFFQYVGVQIVLIHSTPPLQLYIVSIRRIKIISRFSNVSSGIVVKCYLATYTTRMVIKVMTVFICESAFVFTVFSTLGAFDTR